jgi:hypothetical protein
MKYTNRILKGGIELYNFPIVLEREIEKEFEENKK